MYPFLVFCILATPSFAAWPSETVAVGPDGVTQNANKSYYLMANLTKPELPRDGSPTDDCASGSRPSNAALAVQELASYVLANPPDPTTIGSIEPYFPRCVAVPVGCAPTCPATPGLYASYNVSTGRYYVEASLAGVVPHARPSDVILTGTSGIEITTDCVGCPPIKDGGGG